MRNEQIHFAKSGNCAHDIVGPISIPNVGPTLPKQLNVIVIAFVLSIPKAIIVKAQKSVRIR